MVTPETSDLSAPSSSDRDTSDTDGETASDAGTEVGYSLDPDTTITLQSIPDLDGEMAELDNNELRRTASNTYSMYASSEGGGSEFSMVDSMTLPPPPSGNGGWTLVTSDTASEPGDIEPAVVRRNIALGRMGARGWEDRPSFFEYLYGE